ncbi:hypothetical protein BC831DRAFT_151469 [Entophlyctis helioformis]|nr:hypothetical protein BC831DRAFT_151469 [Entophlyctis helioformis]
MLMATSKAAATDARSTKRDAVYLALCPVAACSCCSNSSGEQQHANSQQQDAPSQREIATATATARHSQQHTSSQTAGRRRQSVRAVYPSSLPQPACAWTPARATPTASPTASTSSQPHAPCVPPAQPSDAKAARRIPLGIQPVRHCGHRLCHASSRKHVAASGWLRATAAWRQAAARRRATAAEVQTRQCRTLTTGRETANSRTLTSSLACSSRRLQQRAACWRGPPDCRDCTVCNGIWHTQRHMARNHAGYLDTASSTQHAASTHKPHEHHGSKPRACHAGGRLSGPNSSRNLRVVHLRCDKWMVGENGRLAGSHGFDTARGCLRLACEAVGCVWQARLARQTRQARQTDTLVDATAARTALCWNVD